MSNRRSRNTGIEALGRLAQCVNDEWKRSTDIEDEAYGRETRDAEGIPLSHRH